MVSYFSMGIIQILLTISEDCNVISVDWGPLAECAPWYGVAVANTKKVGARTGQLLHLMKDNFKVTRNQMNYVLFCVLTYLENGTFMVTNPKILLARCVSVTLVMVKLSLAML